MKFFSNKKAVASLIAAAALLSLCCLGFALRQSAGAPQKTVPALSSEISVIELAGEGGVWCGTSDGKLLRVDGSGAVLSETALSAEGTRILYLYETERGLLAVDERQNLTLTDGDGEKILSIKLPGLFVKAAYAGGHFYIAMTSNYSDLYLYRYSASFEAEASGKLYLYNEDTGDMEAATISLYAFYASRDDEKLYLFNDLGQIFILPTDLSSLTKDPAAFMDSGFRELRLERTLNAATYDFLDTFYLVGKDRALYTLSHGVGELVKTDLTFAEEVSFLAYERAQNRLFVNYRLYPDVTVCNLSDLSVSFSFRNEFNLAGMAVDGDGVLYTLYKDGSDYVFTLQNVAELERSAGTGSVAVFLYVTAALFAAAAVFFAVVLAKLRRGKDAYAGIRTAAKRVWRQKFIYIVLLPSIVLLFMFCYYPAVKSLVMAFFDYRSGYPVIFNGFENFRIIFANPTMLEGLRNMAIFLVSDVFFGLVPPILFALCLSLMRSKRLSGLARTLLFIPGVIPGIAGILIWKDGIYGAYGVINTVIKAFNGTPVAFLGDYRWSMFSLVMMGFPFVGSYLIFYGAIINIPPSFYEVAELEGCGILKRVVHVDITFISTQMKYVFVISFIGSVQNVSRVMMTTQGAAGTQIPIYIMYNYLSDNNYGVSSALALLMFAVLMVATVINLRLKTADTDA